MKRTRHKVKKETPQTSTYVHHEDEERDLAYYIHDRVELMHQVFSAIKPKDLKAMIPECVQHISMDDLKELCTEELLGISSKRLCAILDGAEPPTDTESSSSEHLETISLDSISSDDEILSQPTKKKHKHKKHKSRSKQKRKNSKDSQEEKDVDRSKASRAGLTVLELLELQARARAIRAQLQQDNANMPKETESGQVTHNCDSSDEVEIKEEPADVVEISSEDEKPKIEDLPAKPPPGSKEEEQTQNPTTVTKKVNDLTITVPQSTQKKIKLKRNKPVVASNNVELQKESRNVSAVTANDSPAKPTNQSAVETNKQAQSSNSKSKQKKKQKKKDKTKDETKTRKKSDKEGSDHDEITLQLSDTEKMDLLEDLDRKNYDNFTSSSEDSESSSDTDSDDTSKESKTVTEGKNENLVNEKIALNDKQNTTSEKDTCISSDTNVIAEKNKKETTELELGKDDKVAKEITENRSEITPVTNESSNVEINTCKAHEEENALGDQEKSQIPSESDRVQNEVGKELSESDNLNKNKESNFEKIKLLPADGNDVSKESIEEGEIVSNLHKSKDLSEGEITEYEGEILPKTGTEVVCISDEERERRKKKKKKEKKSKKEKKLKKSKSDFHDGSDQNFFTQEPKNHEVQQTTENQVNLVDIDDDIYEILEISDDSSCYEVEGLSVSKEPTAAEIEALSAKIDELHTEDVIVISEEPNEKTMEGINEEVDNISWRDRYLGSTKVKRVLTTANILNALRKKNKELKKKLEESNKTEEIEDKAPVTDDSNFVEGSIDHFNTLEGSTKYVNPVEENTEGKEVTKEMGKDAKQLLKMYKRLLKYNDMNKKKDPNRKKKKKHKKNKEKEATMKEK